MVPLLEFGLVVAFAYVIWRAQRCWPGAGYLIAGAAGFVSASGLLSERLLGSRYSWNFARHTELDALFVFALGLAAFVVGVIQRRRRAA